MTSIDWKIALEGNAARHWISELKDSLLQDDEEAIQATIASETDLIELIGEALVREDEIDALVAAKKEMARRLGEEAKRLEAKKEKTRAKIAQVLKSLQQKRVRTAVGLVSVTKRKATARVHDIDLLPEDFAVTIVTETKKPKPAKEILSEVLRRQHSEEPQLPGVTLIPESTTIIVRRS